MRFVFWLNILSPHQLPYITHLLDDQRVNKVVIVVGENISPERKQMGWEVNENLALTKCDIYINPISSVILGLLVEQKEASVHLFSGISGFKFVHKVLKMSLKFNLRRAIISESPFTYAFNRANGKPILLHKIRFYLKDRKYSKHIDYVFAIGANAVEYYHSVNESWKVFPFAYCTQETHNFSTDNFSNPHFIYVGSLIKRKNPLLLMNVLQNLTEKMSITMIGDGPERKQIESVTMKQKIDNIRILGNIPNSKVPGILCNSDVLILPSIYDGWGAVVNEALMNGLFVICSSNCGAKDLLNNRKCGIIFKSEDLGGLTNAMQYCIDNIESIRRERTYRKEWAIRCIGGSAISKYMIDCIDGLNVEKPWAK